MPVAGVLLHKYPSEFVLVDMAKRNQFLFFYLGVSITLLDLDYACSSLFRCLVTQRAVDTLYSTSEWCGLFLISFGYDVMIFGWAADGVWLS